jgi:hypothetical protein
VEPEEHLGAKNGAAGGPGWPESTKSRCTYRRIGSNAGVPMGRYGRREHAWKGGAHGSENRRSGRTRTASELKRQVRMRAYWFKRGEAPMDRCGR